MASSVSSVALVHVTALSQRPVALRPIDAGVRIGAAPGLEAEALRQAQAFQAETLREAPSDRARQQSSDSSEASQERSSSGGRGAPTGDNTPFLAQLLAQDQPPPRQPNPFAEASRAYGRFREEPRTGFVLDLPERVDVRV